MAVGIEDHGLYKLVDTGESLEHAFAAKSSFISNLWHQRYKQLNIHYLAQLVPKDLVHGLLEILTQNQGVCGACQVGKQHRTPFKDGDSWRASKVLQLVHVDVCGPMNTPSVIGSTYFLLFIDDFNHKMWVYFLRQKLDVFTIFQKFKALVEKESSCPMVTLRSDNWGGGCLFYCFLQLL